MMTALIVIALCAGLNRARGDARWMPAWLPGRALWYVAPAIAVVALIAQPPLTAALLGLAYLFWGVPAWGRWFDLGRLPESAPGGTDFFDVLAEWLFGQDHAVLFVRMLLVVPPLWLISEWAALLGIAFAALAVAAYELAWRWRPDNPIWLAELMVGALWGTLIILI